MDDWSRAILLYGVVSVMFSTLFMLSPEPQMVIVGNEMFSIGCEEDFRVVTTLDIKGLKELSAWKGIT